MTKIRLLARCQIHGEVKEPGYVFGIPDHETPEARAAFLRSLPHRTVDHGGDLGASHPGHPGRANVKADLHNESINAIKPDWFTGEYAAPVRDVPLFEVIEDEDEAEEEAPVLRTVDPLTGDTIETIEPNTESDSAERHDDGHKAEEEAQCLEPKTATD